MRDGPARRMPSTVSRSGPARVDEESTMARGVPTSRGRGWMVVVAALLPLAIAARVDAAAGDTIADRVLGQADFMHATNPSFIRARSLNIDGDPRGNAVAIDVAHDPSPIYVVDTGSSRVLGWHDVAAFTNGADADLVIGAPDFFTGPQGCQRTATAFCFPLTVGVDPAGALYVSGDHVEKFDAPFAQSLPVSGTSFVNNGTDPWGVAVDAQGNVYIAFRNQHMVIEYDAGSTTPHLVFGQASASGGGCNQGGSASAATVCAPYGVAVDAGG